MREHETRTGAIIDTQFVVEHGVMGEGFVPIGDPMSSVCDAVEAYKACSSRSRRIVEVTTRLLHIEA